MLDLLELFPLKYVALVPVLNAIGYFLKHRTPVPNEFIPAILFAVASATSIPVRWLFSGETGWLFWFDAVFLYGIVNSLKLTISAIGSYEAVRALRFSGRRMEVQMIKRPFVRLLLAFISASLLFGIVALIFGASFFDIFFKITDGWIFGIFFMGAFDIFSKIAKHPEKVTPLYIVTIASVMLSASMFCMASMAADVRVAFAGITLTGLFIAASAACILVPFIKAKKTDAGEVKDFSADEYQKEWAKVRAKIGRLSKEKQIELLEGFLLFHLIGDSIYNNVDMTRPLFDVKADDGTMVLVPVAKASGAGVAEADVETAKAYISKLVG